MHNSIPVDRYAMWFDFQGFYAHRCAFPLEDTIGFHSSQIWPSVRTVLWSPQSQTNVHVVAYGSPFSSSMSRLSFVSWNVRGLDSKRFFTDSKGCRVGVPRLCLLKDSLHHISSDSQPDFVLVQEYKLSQAQIDRCRSLLGGQSMTA